MPHPLLSSGTWLDAESLSRLEVQSVPKVQYRLGSGILLTTIRDFLEEHQKLSVEEIPVYRHLNMQRWNF